MGDGVRDGYEHGRREADVAELGAQEPQPMHVEREGLREIFFTQVIRDQRQHSSGVDVQEGRAVIVDQSLQKASRGSHLL